MCSVCVPKTNLVRSGNKKALLPQLFHARLNSAAEVRQEIAAHMDGVRGIFERMDRTFHMARARKELRAAIKGLHKHAAVRDEGNAGFADNDVCTAPEAS